MTTYKLTVSDMGKADLYLGRIDALSEVTVEIGISEWEEHLSKLYTISLSYTDETGIKKEIGYVLSDYVLSFVPDENVFCTPGTGTLTLALIDEHGDIYETAENIVIVSEPGIVPFSAMSLSIGDTIIIDGDVKSIRPHVIVHGREMHIPDETREIAVRGDMRAVRVRFDVDRFYDGVDLGACTFYVELLNANLSYDKMIPSTENMSEIVEVTWEVQRRHVSEAGEVHVRLRAEKNNYIWQTYTGVFTVHDTFDGAEKIPEDSVTLFEQAALIAQDAAKQAQETANEAKTTQAEIETQWGNAIERIEAEADKFAPPIISTAEGVACVAADSADRPLRGLTVYGRTTLDGTQVEDAPVVLTGVWLASPLRIVTAGKNLAALTPRTESNLGITSSYDAQTGVVTVTGTATGHAFVSYWLRELIPAGVPLVIGMGNASSDGNIAIRAQSASESAITTIATLDSDNKVVKATLKHALEFISIRVNAGTTVNMELRIGVTVGSSVTGYAWTHPDEKTIAQISMPVWENTVGGLLHGVPASGSDATYVDADGQGWIADTIEYDAQTGTAQIVRRVASVTYDGNASEGWVKGGSNSYFAIRRSDKSSASHGLCTHYQGLAINAGESKVGFTAATDASYIRFRPVGYADMTVDAWRARLNASPVTVLYALAVPEITPITGDELAALTALRSRYPATTAFNDAGAQMAVRYIADTKNYIDQRIEQLTNAVVSTGENI